MFKIPKKVSERLTKTVGKFQKVLQNAKDRDVNEADTVSIICDIFAEVFGFNKYTEITSEYAIRNTYCDLAIKIKDKPQYLIEVKAIGLTLKDNHLKQAVDYGANHGIPWVVLTNGIIYEIYNIRFEKPINHELVCSFDFLNLNPRKTDDQEKLYLLCKEGLQKAARETFFERIQSINRFVIASIILSHDSVNLIRRELRKLSPGLKVDPEEIEKILTNEVLKREVLEGEDATKARARVKRITRAPKKTSTKEKPTKETSTSLPAPIPKPIDTP